MKGKIVGALTAVGLTGAAYLARDEIGKLVDSGIRGLASSLVPYLSEGQNSVTDYFLQQAKQLNQKLGSDMATGIFVTAGLCAAVLVGYAWLKYRTKDV